MSNSLIFIVSTENGIRGVMRHVASKRFVDCFKTTSIPLSLQEQMPLSAFVSYFFFRIILNKYDFYFVKRLEQNWISAI